MLDHRRSIIILISVNCNTEFRSLSSDLLFGYIKTQGIELGLNGSGVGLMIFLNMSSRTHHNCL